MRLEEDAYDNAAHAVGEFLHAGEVVILSDVLQAPPALHLLRGSRLFNVPRVGPIRYRVLDVLDNLDCLSI